MHIERIGRPATTEGVPIISFATVYGDIVYSCGVTADPRKELGDVKQQTRDALAQIDAILKAAGTGRSKVLTAQVWLTDMSDFADHNDAWNEWVDAEHPPVRACLHSPQLWAPGLLVEIMVTAAK